MKREDLKNLELPDEAIEAIMKLHGKDLESHKAAITEAENQVKALDGQLQEATKAIEGFKSMDVEAIKQAADEWKAAAEKAKADGEAAIQKLRFDQALDNALKAAKARDTISVRANLDPSLMKLDEGGENVVGLAEQLEKIKAAKAFLFESDDKAPPQVIAGASGANLNTDKMMQAALEAAQLPIK